MGDIIFKGGKIQTGHRIKIPKPIIDTLDLKEGQQVVLKFDSNKKTIVIETEDSKEDKK